MLRLDDTCIVVTDVATHLEVLYQKYFIYPLILYLTDNFKIQVHLLTKQLHVMESFMGK
jgi:hypothetical protein